MASPQPATTRGRAAVALQQAWQGRGALSTALLPASWGFAAIAEVRRSLFERGLLASSRLPVPVIVVGNLLVGGAGKTPTVLAVVELLRARGYRPGIVSRGYGRAGAQVTLVEPDARAADVGDEPLLLRRRSGVPVAVCVDRVAAGHALLRANADVDVVVSDDGLQHLPLERDVEVLVFDERGSGNGRLLPAGPLREHLPARLAPGQLVLYNADAPTTALPGHLARRRLAGVTSLADWWAGAPPSDAALSSLARREGVVAVAGTARPGRFFAMLRAHGLSIVEWPLEDHADFGAVPWPPNAADVVLTEKDAVKLSPSRPLGTRVWVARLDFDPDPAFDAALLALLPLPSSIEPHGNPPA